MKKNGRPDITGCNVNGEKSVIIEGKFWVYLTDNQPNNYLKELHQNGKLLFLAPNKRIESLKLDIKNRLQNHHDDRVVIFSWSQFLSFIEKENQKEYDPQLA